MNRNLNLKVKNYFDNLKTSILMNMVFKVRNDIQYNQVRLGVGDEAKTWSRPVDGRLELQRRHTLEEFEQQCRNTPWKQ